MELGGARSGAQFGIDFDHDAGRTVLTLHGELDAVSVPPFAAVLHALADRGARSVTIDLSDLRFCNIGGLRAMAELAARLHAPDDARRRSGAIPSAAEGRVEILAPDILTRMLGIADLRSLFTIGERPGRGSQGRIDLEAESIETFDAGYNRIGRTSLHRDAQTSLNGKVKS